ncbi:hypothetical protein Lal_00036037 [Lupinus albus]|nr:hypothetical protein Lal_00036037 [Lupinus albus]
MLEKKCDELPIFEQSKIYMTGSRQTWFGHLWKRSTEAPVRIADRMKTISIPRGRERLKKITENDK